MTERSSEGLDVRRRKLLFRAWRRGVREMDLIVGRFADVHIDTLDDAGLDDFERLIEAPNAELYAWVVGAETVPADYDTAVLAKLKRLSPARRQNARRGGAVTASLRSPARSPAQRLRPGRPLLLAGIADGAEGLVLADLARAIAAGAAAPAISLAVICRDGPRMATLSRALAFFAPDIEVLEFPAWDCLPYDRVSPHAGVVAQRMTALARLARVKGRDRPADRADHGQRRPAARAAARDRSPGNRFRPRRQRCSPMARRHAMARAQRLHPRRDRARAGRLRGARRHRRSVRARHGRRRCGSISSATRWNRSAASIRRPSAPPTSCARSISCRWRSFSSPRDTIRLFRTGYVAAFGAAAPDDVLYEAVSEGRRTAGVEHWLPLFHAQLETLFDYLDGSAGRDRAAGRGSRARAAGADRRLLPGAQGRARSGRAAARPTSRCRRTGSISPKPNGASGWNDPRWRGCRRSPRRKAAPMRSRSARAPATTSPPSGASPAPMSSRR